jgi:hypothetical protein
MNPGQQNGVLSFYVLGFCLITSMKMSLIPSFLAFPPLLLWPGSFSHYIIRKPFSIVTKEKKKKNYSPFLKWVFKRITKLPLQLPNNLSYQECESPLPFLFLSNGHGVMEKENKQSAFLDSFQQQNIYVLDTAS